MSRLYLWWHSLYQFETRAAQIKMQREKLADANLEKLEKLKTRRDTSNSGTGTLLTLHSYMFHVFCFTSIKVIIFNTDILNSRAGTFSLTHSLTHSLSLTYWLTHSLTGLLTGLLTH